MRERFMRRAQLALMATGALLTSASIASANCRTINSNEAIKHAIGKGFQFTATVVNGTGTCGLSGTYFIVSASANGDLSCQLVFFGGRPLTAGWTIEDVEWDGGSVTPPTLPVPFGHAVVFTAPRGESKVFGIKQLTLKGGDCASWKNAFSLVP